MSRISLQLERGDWSLDASLDLVGVTGLLGPNGCGKSTLLAAIAGLIRARGTVMVGEAVLQDGERWLRPEERRVGVVFQDLRLFPHRSVRWNLEYGSIGTADALVDRLGLGPLIDRLPGELSGGERQKVALGRALAMEPQLLLLDEPFSALDGGSRAELIPWVGDAVRQAGVPALVVGHRLDELLALTERLAVMDGGRIVGEGRASEVLGQEAMLGLAHRMGLENVLRFEVVEGVASVGGQLLVLPPGIPTAVRSVRLRPEDVVLAVGETGRTSARNVLVGPVESLTVVEGRVVARVAVGDGLSVELTQGAVDELGLVVGTEVRALFKATALRW